MSGNKPMENEKLEENSKQNVIKEEKMWKKMGLDKYVAVGVTAFLVLAAVVFFGFCLLKIRSIGRVLMSILNVLTPILYGIVIAYVLRPIYNRLEVWLEREFTNNKMKPEKADSLSKIISSIVVVLLLAGLGVAVVAILIPELYNSLLGLTENFPSYEAHAREWLHGVLAKYPTIDETVMSYFDNLSGMTSDVLAKLFPEMSTVFGMVSSGVGSMLSFLYNLFIGLIVAMYVLNEKDTLTAQCRKLMFATVKPGRISLLRGEIQYADKMFSGFVFAKVIDSIALGIVYAILAVIFKIPYVGMISVVVGVTNMIPFFGPYIGAVPCALILLLISPIEAVKFFVIDMVIMQVDANLISPKILGSTTGLSGFWVLFSILFFGGIWGFFGMLVGVPLFAVIYHLFGSLLNYRLNQWGQPTDVEEYVVEPTIAKADVKFFQLRRGKKKNVKNKKSDADNK